MMGKVQDKKAAVDKEETVDDLLHKLAKKGKKVKLLDESASIKDLNTQKRDSVQEDENFDRDGDNIDVQNVDDDIGEEIDTSQKDD